MGLTRREFVRGLGLALAAVPIGCGAAVGPGQMVDPTPSGTPGSSPGPSPSSPGDPPSQPSTAQLTGRIVRPGDPDYDAARANFNGRFDVHPQVIVFAATAADVVNAISWAAKNDVPLRARAGRHSYEGYSLVDNGLVLDVSAMNAVALDAAAGTVRVGAGVTLMALYDSLYQSGRVTVPAGSCASLGITGLTLGGGFGLLGRKYGLTCDHLTAADLVTADGRIVRATASQNADLFWALRGGGGGNFAVVTALELSVQPAADVSTYSVSWPIADFPSVLAAWQKWAPYADPGLVSILSVDKTTVYSGGQYVGAATDLQRLLAPLTSVGSPSGLTLEDRSYIDAVHAFGDDNAASRPKFKNASAYVTSPLGDPAVKVILDQLASAPGPNNTIQLDAMGGAVASGDGAFAHRAALYSIQLESYWENAADEAANRLWIAQTRGALAPYTQGAYVNYCDGDLANFADAYYGASRAQLESTRQSWDPDRFFSFPQAI